MPPNNDSPNANAPRGWYRRRNLPHADFAGTRQFITYHLADSVPAEVQQRLASETSPASDTAYRKRIEAYMDAGDGSCILRRAEIAQVVIDAWKYYDGVRYDLHSWVVMPNHVHLLITMRETKLETIVHGWKSFTANTINRMLGQSGQVWHRNYWDRYIRDEVHFAAAENYIRQNPVKAGLVKTPEEWPWLGCKIE